jgi:hypothetical protein
MDLELRRFLGAKLRSLTTRSRRMAQLDPRSVGIRPEDRPYVPSQAHFDAANARLAEIDKDVRASVASMRSAFARRGTSEQILGAAATVERHVDRARRAYGLFFEVFSQRGTSFAPALAACDVIAADCFQVVRRHAPGLLGGPLLKPVTYLEHGFSPATFRRGVVLSRLLGEQNPFPLVRIPYERIEQPWGMGVLLHEIGHNLQADLGVWQETRQALQRRMLTVTRNPWITRVWTRWHREIFADLIAILLGGPASARAMKDFLAYPAGRVLTFRPLGVHPSPYLRVFVLSEMLRRMGFEADARVIADNWDALYTPHLSRARIPAPLLATAQRLIPHVVDEIAFQPRRGLAQRALVDVVPFRAQHEKQIRAAAEGFAGLCPPRWRPPRFGPSASRYAFERGLAAPSEIASTVLNHFARSSAAAPRAADPKPEAA